MKTLKKPLVYVALALMPMLFSKCTLSEDLNKLKASADSVQIILGTPKFNTAAHFEFIDEETNLPISDKDIKVLVTGKDSCVMFDNIGKQSKEYTAKWGMLDLVVDPHKIDTSRIQTNPVQFNLTSSLEGYETISKLILLSESGTTSMLISMKKKSSEPIVNDTVKINLGSTDDNGELNPGVISFSPFRKLKASSSGSSPTFYLEGLASESFYDSNNNKLKGEVTIIGNFYGGFKPYSTPELKSIYDAELDYTYLYYFSKYLDYKFDIYVTSKTGFVTQVSRVVGGYDFVSVLPGNLISIINSAPFSRGGYMWQWDTSKMPYRNPTKLIVDDNYYGEKIIRSHLDTKGFTYGGTMNAIVEYNTIAFNGVVTNPDAKAIITRYSTNDIISKCIINLYNPTGGDKVVKLKDYIPYSQDRVNFYVISDCTNNPDYKLTFSNNQIDIRSNFQFTRLNISESKAIHTLNMRIRSWNPPNFVCLKC